jgi:hypothetical protein
LTSPALRHDVAGVSLGIHSASAAYELNILCHLLISY